MAAIEKQTQNVGLTDGEGKVARLDKMSAVLVGIANAHHRIHGGDSYMVSAVDESMGDGDTLILGLKTPVTKRMHLVVSFTATVAGHVTVTEAPTWTTNTGTATTVYNRHRGSDNTSEVSEDKSATPAFTAGGVLTNPTGGSGGTVVETHYVLAASGNRSGGEARGTEEIILKQATQYLITFVADGGSNGAQLRLDWYEREDSTAA